MLKRKDLSEELNSPLMNANSVIKSSESLLLNELEVSEGILGDLMKNYSKVQIEDPIRAFNENNLQEIANNVDYGVLKVLEGTWVSYNNDSENRIGTGIHTTIMPSPGTNSGGIPGKYSFLCEEYIEKLTFDLVPGGVRNRGGGNEQFCGAIKYDQSIKSVNRVQGETVLQYASIHEENGMYLWLSDIFNYAANDKTIKEDRGIHALSPTNPNKDLYKSGYQDETLFLVLNNGKEEYVTQENLNGRPYTKIIAAKELKAGAGQTGPYFIPDYSISRSGVIPHGSTITLLGDLVPVTISKKQYYVIDGPPQFPEGDAAWKYDHLAISRTMGGAGASETPPDQINLDEPAPAWVHEVLNDVNDPGENKIYTQRILAHDLYPYSVRPDLRLRDSIKDEKIKNHVHIQMSSKNKTGAQGGILNVPFVNRFVPTVEMNMNMWVETVVEDGKEILQLQYEQIIFFEFHFGDDGGTTSWPHIQINTLRKLEDVPADQKTLAEDQFGIKKTEESYKTDSSAKASGCPYNKE